MEKVDNAPQNPVIIKNLYSGWRLFKGEYIKNPTTKLPIKLTVKVPRGNPNLAGIILDITYLNIAPKNPPIPI